MGTCCFAPTQESISLTPKHKINATKCSKKFPSGKQYNIKANTNSRSKTITYSGSNAVSSSSKTARHFRSMDMSKMKVASLSGENGVPSSSTARSLPTSGSKCSTALTSNMPTSLLLFNAASCSTTISSAKSVAQIKEEFKFIDQYSPLLTLLCKANSAEERKLILANTRLGRDQTLTRSRSGADICSLVISTHDLLTRRRVEKQRKGPLPPDHRTIIQPPFSNMDLIVSTIYLTGMYGLTKENFRDCKIGLVINATIEYPLIRSSTVESYRVPVEDDPDDNISIYFEDVVDLIESMRRNGRSTVIHCAAGVSRSATIVLAYLLKYSNLTLHEAFILTYATRPCIRPNMAFFRSLTEFERKYPKEDSNRTYMVEVKDATTGLTVCVPDFYPEEYPLLYQKALQKLQYKPRTPNADSRNNNNVKNSQQK